ncbi:MAG: hypothetical protein HKO66_15475 [Saprospiraceae bacterium]|nr:hypothetical protein [Bacteroidia bacterium]NNL93641.1 hypothetical protein [Saprospiraceae bacterium]
MRLLVIPIVFFMFFSCGEPGDNIDSCNEIELKGDIPLSEESLSYFPEKYLSGFNDIILFNENGDSLILEHGGKSSSFVTQVSRKPCNDIFTAFTYEMEQIYVWFRSEKYNLRVDANVSLDYDFNNIENAHQDTFSLNNISRDTCYEERFNLSININKRDSTFNYLNIKMHDSCPEDIFISTPQFANFDSLELNGLTYTQVISNLDFFNPDYVFLRFYYNKEYGFIGFEDEFGELWTIRI